MKVFKSVVEGDGVIIVAADTAREAKKTLHNERREDSGFMQIYMERVVFEQLADTQYQGAEPKVLLIYLQDEV